MKVSRKLHLEDTEAIFILGNKAFLIAFLILESLQIEFVLWLEVLSENYFVGTP